MVVVSSKQFYQTEKMVRLNPRVSSKLVELKKELNIQFMPDMIRHLFSVIYQIAQSENKTVESYLKKLVSEQKEITLLNKEVNVKNNSVGRYQPRLFLNEDEFKSLHKCLLNIEDYIVKLYAKRGVEIKIHRNLSEDTFRKVLFSSLLEIVIPYCEPHLKKGNCSSITHFIPLS